jgi:acyl dehydratase
VNAHDLGYFDDYGPGTTYDCGIVRVDQAEIIAFAKEYDPQPFHVDPVAAASGPFGGLIASGQTVMRATAINFLRVRQAGGA